MILEILAGAWIGREVFGGNNSTSDNSSDSSNDSYPDYESNTASSYWCEPSDSCQTRISDFTD
jgi:hypothetical protein